MKSRPAQSGFSLVELSIVLVILGLLTGGILAGQSLIRAAELRGVTNEAQRNLTAIRTFQDKYFNLPGDIPNATAFWGIAGGSGADVTCRDTVSTDARTCNGDGNGVLQPNNPVYEFYRFWQHLANAGLIQGSYIGTQPTLAGYTAIYVAGVSNPASRISGAFWGTTGVPSGILTASTNRFELATKNFMWHGNGSAAASDALVLRPEEAWNVDTKMDDGMPGTGSVVSNKGNGTSTFCTSVAGTTGSDAGATYLLTNINRDCQLNFHKLY